MYTVIKGFTGRHAYLSNFHYGEKNIVFDDCEYRTVEHAYRAAKTLDKDVRTQIRFARTPGQAKKLGKHVQLRPDWEKMKLMIMYGLVLQKFQDPVLRSLLLGTDDALLQEGNWWHDTFWGVNIHTGVGENHLGKILMRVRDELRQIPPIK
jgi:ribA/ribD-fused uncharacterized protein